MKSEKQKMLAGELYSAADRELQAEHRAARLWMDRYNAPHDSRFGERLALLREGLGDVGDGVVVRAPFHCDYGYNISLGDNVFLNFGCVLLDVCEISIGAGTQIGPHVQIYAADHPRDPEPRRAGLENGKPVRIGRNVWIGGGAILLPGVTVGDDAIVGAGAVVSRDVPAGATVAGNPARPVR
jgi:maltose O-acetyltransferase